jgi:hypothetical protein
VAAVVGGASEHEISLDSRLSSCLLRCAKLCSQWSLSFCMYLSIVSRIFIGFSPIVFAHMMALWWKTCECNCASKFDRISYLTAIARAWNLGDIRLYRILHLSELCGAHS